MTNIYFKGPNITKVSNFLDFLHFDGQKTNEDLDILSNRLLHMNLLSNWELGQEGISCQSRDSVKNLTLKNFSLYF